MIHLDNIYKHYQLYSNDFQRLKEVITGRSTAEVIKALDPVSLTIEKGQVVGIIGNNGAGKSTLLKLISGTASPSGGNITITGRISALLELGTGFHPELSGHENIYLYGAILGLSRTQMDSLYDDIVAFSGVERFIHQAVKTYSSGMFVRLAFSVATSVDPDILIIDEALSVGDGNFARKSFDRIMSFKESGKTILFCSHSMFHIESICDRAIWIDDGRIKMDGLPASVVSAYNASMKIHKSKTHAIEDIEKSEVLDKPIEHSQEHTQGKLAQFIKMAMKIDASTEPYPAKLLKNHHKYCVQSGVSSIIIKVTFESNFSIKTPNFAVTITDENDFNIASACTLMDAYSIERDVNGLSHIELRFPKLSLLKGKYYLYAYLMCEQCIFIYESAPRFAEFEIVQSSNELGIVSLAHLWDKPL